MDLGLRDENRSYVEDSSGQRFYVPKREKFDMAPELVERGKFKDFLSKKHSLSGGRPYLSEREILNKIDSTVLINEKALWGHVFGNQIQYGDVRNLPTRAQGAWNTALSKMRKNADKQVRAQMKSQVEEYDYNKGMIDEEMKAYDSYVGKKAGAKKPKDTTKAILDLLEGGTFNDAPNNVKIAIRSMLPNSAFGLGSEKVPAEKGWLGGIKTSETIRNFLIPTEQTARTALAPQQGIRQPVSPEINDQPTNAIDPKELYAEFSKIETEPEKEAYLLALRNSSPDLYEMLKNMVRGAGSKEVSGNVTTLQDYMSPGATRRRSLGRTIKRTASGLGRNITKWPGDVR